MLAVREGHTLIVVPTAGLLEICGVTLMGAPQLTSQTRVTEGVAPRVSVHCT